MTSQAQKAYDVTVYGATGYTGKLCVEHLVSHPQAASFKWAIAGRSASKLESLKTSYKLPSNVGIFQADNSTQDVAKSGLLEMVANSKVILNLVGPYRQHGSFRLAELCAQQGTHYADLSGESDYSARIQQNLDSIAAKSGAILLPSSGFDSIPCDVATYLGVRRVRQLAAERGLDVDAVEARSGTHMAGSFSGGTLASLVSMGSSPETRWIMKPERPFEIAGPQHPKATSQVHTESLVRLPQFNSYGAFMPLGVHNGRVVYQSAKHIDSASKTGEVYGPNFQVVDAAVPVKGVPLPVSLIVASVFSAIGKFFLYLIFNSSKARAFVTRVLPPGSGPSEKSRNNGFVDVRSLVTAYPKQSTGAGSKRTQSPVSAVGYWMARKADPGYLMTSRVLCETGLFLALEAAQNNVAPGVRTAASLGDAGVDALVDRLNQHESFSIGVRDTKPSEGHVGRLSRSDRGLSRM
ncbi:unnamed protein product [Parajaminaea phylloscopi]